MKRSATLITAALITAALAGALSISSAPAQEKAPSARPAHWGYEGAHGPKYWGSLSPAYAIADKGKAQSPIDLAEAGAVAQKDWKVDYVHTSLKIAHHENVPDILDNGHTIQVTVDEGSSLTTSRNKYALKQFHFHTPSEHTLNGRHFPMEAHLVHQSADGQFAVIAAFFVEGAANENLAKLIANFPKAKGDVRILPEVKLDMTLQIPKNNAGFTYQGSFTTPPCTEGVEWLVFREPIPASREQLAAFAARLHQNNRPVQPRHDRRIEAARALGLVAP